MRNLKMNSRWMKSLIAIAIAGTYAATLQGASKGPDAQGYTASDQTVFSYLDISGAGGGTAILAGTDDGTAFLTLPFSFQFYGVSYTGVCVSSNGAAYFTPDAAACSSITDFANVDLSSATTPSDLPAVLPFWTDLTFSTPGAGAVYYQSFGSTGSRRFVIQWANAYAANSSSPVNFEIVLTEGTNAIAVQYQTVNLGAGDPASNGGTSTVGIHNTGGLAANQQIAWSFGVPVLSNGYALSFLTTAPGPFVLTAPLNAAAGVALPVTLTWNASANATSYDVYLGTTNPPALVTNVAATSYTAPSLANSTVYYWQIIAKNTSGTSKSQVFSFTTAAPVAGSNVITFSQPPDTALSAGPVTLAAAASSGLTVSYTSNSTGVCTVAGSSVTLVAVGGCSITANQAGDASFAPATAVTKTFNVTVNPNVITFSQPPDTLFSAGPVTLTATASSALAVTYTSNSTGVCTVLNSTVTLVATGTCSITANQSGNATFAAATPVTKSFNVASNPNVITFPQPSDTLISAGPVVMTATASSALAVTYTSNSTGVCTVLNSSVTLVAAGTCSITANQAGNATFAAATPVTKTFNVTLSPNVITFPQPADTALTGGPVTMTGSATSGSAVTYTSNTTGVCTVSGASVALVSAGSCSITASQAATGNFAAAVSVTQTFNVLKGSQTITFTQPADTALSAGPVTLTATATSSLSISFASNSGTVCTVSSSSVTLVATGTCSITASQAGNANYNAATPVTKTFTVTPAALPVTVSLAVGDGNGFAGDVVELPITLTSTGTPALATFQLDLNFDQTKLTFKSARVGAQSTAAGKSISINAQANGDIRLLGVGFNQNVIANGIVAYASFTLGSPFSAASVTPKACTSADGNGITLGTACTAGTIKLPSCDINVDGTTNVADVQLIINEALGVNPQVHDLNHDGSVNVADVQKVINAALGLGCSVQ